MKDNKSKLCKHNLLFCCRCYYGSLRRKEERSNYDLVDEVENMPKGYKMSRGFKMLQGND